MVLKAIVLDFDGVILESVDIKTRAFRELFKNYPEHVDDIAAYHLKNGGMSRFKKFAYIYSEILKKPLYEDEIKKLGESFSKIVLSELISCPYVKGAQEFLKEYSNKTNLFIASGTPVDELRYITDKRNISQYFKGIYGTPLTKSEILKKIGLEFGFKNSDLIFIGDSINDYDGAKDAGVLFIARLDKKMQPNPFNNLNLCAIKDFDDLKIVLKNRTL